MTHYQSAVDLTVGCIIVQRRHLSEASGSGRHNSSSQNGLIKLQEVFDSTREMENKRLIKNLSCHRRRDCGCRLRRSSSYVETPRNVLGLQPSQKKYP